MGIHSPVTETSSRAERQTFVDRCWLAKTEAVSQTVPHGRRGFRLAQLDRSRIRPEEGLTREQLTHRLRGRLGWVSRRVWLLETLAGRDVGEREAPS